MPSLAVLEPVSFETFEARAYLLANPDIQAAGVDAFEHFKMFGHSENRYQISNEILTGSRYRKEKFERFKNVLRPSEGEDMSEFPAFYGGKHFTIDEYQAESANGDFEPFISEIEVNPNKLYLDLGCGLRRRVFENCLYLEVYPSLAADIVVAPDCTYPVKDQSLDGIGCFAVLEHVVKPWVVVKEIHRMLKPGGKVFIDWPFLQPVHGFPSHYFNTTREGLASIFRNAGFEVESAATLGHQTPDHTISWVLGKFLRDCPDDRLRSRVLEMKVGDLISHLPGDAFWLELLAAYPDKSLSEFACGNTLIGIKI